MRQQLRIPTTGIVTLIVAVAVSACAATTPEPAPASPEATPIESSPSTESASSAHAIDEAMAGPPAIVDPLEGEAEYLGFRVSDFPIPPAEVAMTLGQDRADRFGADALYALAVFAGTSTKFPTSPTAEDVPALHDRFSRVWSASNHDWLNGMDLANVENLKNLHTYWMFGDSEGMYIAGSDKYPIDLDRPWHVRVDNFRFDERSDNKSAGDGTSQLCPVLYYDRHYGTPIENDGPAYLSQSVWTTFCWDGTGRWVADSSMYMNFAVTRPDGSSNTREERIQSYWQ